MTHLFNQKHFPHLEAPHALPRLPVPDLEDTLKQYLWTTSAIANNEDELRQTKLNVARFRDAEGPSLHAELLELAKTTPTSWLEGWWDTMYLTIRSPSAVHVNPFFVFKDDPMQPTQARRAGALAHACLRFFDKIRNNQLPQEMERDTPLCMCQYGRMFGTQRIPRPGRDELVTYPDSTHIIVMHRGEFFVLSVVDEQGAWLTEQELSLQFQLIVEHQKGLRIFQPPVGLFTTEERDVWAGVRASLLPDNDAALSEVDRALFVVCLDIEKPEGMDELSKLALHSDGKNRFFDKSLQIIVSANGRAAVNMEHSPMDGLTVLVLCAEIYQESVKSVGAEKRVHGPFRSNLPKPRKLEWKLDVNALKALDATGRKYKELCAVTDTCVLEFGEYGKDWITSQKLSPDALVQLAFQLAFYRLYGKTGSTYESAHTKRFYHGRTETLRSVTPDSARFTRAFAKADAQGIIPPADVLIKARMYIEPGQEPSSDRCICSSPEECTCRHSKVEREIRSELMQLLHQAIQMHVKQMNRCKENRGVDRHLYGMHWLAKQRQERIPGYQIPDIYRDPMYARMRTDLMSTSNCGNQALCLFGFGPVCPEGLGLGYFISNDIISVNITSFMKEAKHFATALSDVLVQLRWLVENSKGSKEEAKKPRL